MPQTTRLDPYAELGVPLDATPAAIRAGFRRRAKETHPDQGGDPAAFQRVKRASLVLLDPKRRAKFDATGEIEDEAPDNALSEVMVAASQLLDAAIVRGLQQGGSLLAKDIVRMMGDIAREAKTGIGQQRRQFERHLEISLTLERRFRLRAGVEGPNRMAALLEQRIAAQRANIENNRREEAKLDRTLLFLLDYEYDQDKAAAPMTVPVAPGAGPFVRFQFTG